MNLYNGDSDNNNPDVGKDSVEFLVVAFLARRTQIYANQSDMPVNLGENVVVNVDRGEDLGRVMHKLPPWPVPEKVSGTLKRIARIQDLDRYSNNRSFENRVLSFCRKRIQARELEMHLTACESQLDRKKIRIYFTADHRMDFRDLVRDLAGEFHARIELRQLGVRDDAKFKDGIGICGRRLCCSGFLRDFTSVTLRSVREQRLSPNPAKISGVCSRLMCCLAYESEFYRKANRTYPEQGLSIRLDSGKVTIDRVDIFKDSISILHEDGKAEEITSEEFHRRRIQGRKKRSTESHEDANLTGSPGNGTNGNSENRKTTVGKTVIR